jgi:hypothetical protein
MKRLRITNGQYDSFVIEGADYEALHTLILAACENLREDLHDPKLSDVSISAVSRELDIFERMKLIFKEETPDD